MRPKDRSTDIFHMALALILAVGLAGIALTGEAESKTPMSVAAE